MENLFDFLENKSKEEKQENIILETQTIKKRLYKIK